MIVLDGIEIKNFKNIKHAHLKDLNRINIFIGPNNCGKSNLLEAIKKLKTIEGSKQIKTSCETCSLIVDESNWFSSYVCAKDKRDAYEGKLEPEVVFSFNEEYLNTFDTYQKFTTNLSGFSEELYNALTQRKKAKLKKEHFASKTSFMQHVKEWANRISLHGHQANLMRSLHGSFIDSNIIREIKIGILECPEQRLETYKGQKIADYVKGEDLADTELRRVQEYVRDSVDSKLENYKSASLDYLRGPGRFSTPISEQGSGVRSVICLTSDIISGEDVKVILIDEPELGLNPAARREFVNFLKQETEGKQVFIATHDPIFVNPNLWDDGKLNIYLFSIVKNEFVKVDLDQNVHDPNTFAGYLPHTTSLKDFHLYVEGKYDVYIHQVFFRKFLRRAMHRLTLAYSSRSFHEILARIGIFHLGGSFWRHLLHTLPRKPYKVLLVFDGDKKDDVKQALNKFNENRLMNLPKLIFTDQIDFTSNIYEGAIPAYCLSKEKIEDYLNPKPPSKSEGPNTAMSMREIPKEFGDIYEEALKVIIHKKTDNEEKSQDFDFP